MGKVFAFVLVTTSKAQHRCMFASALIFHSSMFLREKARYRLMFDIMSSYRLFPSLQNGRRMPLSDTSHAGPPQWAESQPL